jgi:O-antigen ligase
VRSNRHRAHSSSATAQVRKIVWYRDLPAATIFAIIAIAPFPFGSVSPVAVSILCGLAGLAIAVFALKPPPLPSPIVVCSVALVLVCGYAAVLWLQLAPRLPGDPLAQPIWGQASELLGQKLVDRASIANDQPYFAVGVPLLTVLLFLGGYICGADDGLARLLLRAVAWIGGCYAVFAICSFAMEPTMVLWREKIAYASSLTGTFTNRNTAAVYFGSSAIVWLVISLQQMQSKRRRRHRRTWTKLRSAFIPLAFFAMCIFAVLLSGSRAGAASTFVGLLVAFVITFRRTLSQRTRRWLAFGGTAFVVFMIYQVFDSEVGNRLQSEGVAGGGRTSGVYSVLHMISEFPWLGTGLGTFRWGFSAYRSNEISGWGVWDKAHNVILELAAEGGLVLAGLVLLAWVAVIGILVFSVVRTPRPAPLVLAALAVSTVASLHSLVDFSMQIPGYAVTVAAVLGGGLAQALRPPETSGAPLTLNGSSERAQPSNVDVPAPNC